MTDNDWEARYQSGDMPWEKGEASPGLVDFLAAHSPADEVSRSTVHQLSKSAPPQGAPPQGAPLKSASVETVCVPGCGTGHDVRAWASASYHAFGFDIAPSAIRLCEEKTRGTNLHGHRLSPLPRAADEVSVQNKSKLGQGEGQTGSVHYQLADFLNDPPPQRFDWIWEHTLYCAINPDQRAAYADAVVRWLKDDGQFLAVHYLIPDQDGPPFGTTRDEVVARFSPHFELLGEWVPRSYPNRTGLELMLWWKRKPV